ncbi:dienelactone hydrolase [Pseudoxanthomonas winnipegensis]|nr:dienelactone hydrolase [Pseudoxanthomonas winnipegensis]
MDVTLEHIAFEVEDAALSGTLLAPARALPGVLFVHGWGGSQDHDLARAREAAGLGVVCLTFDLRGHEGDAQMLERVTRQQNLDDLLAAYDWFVQQPNVDGNAITVVGISYGAYLAAILSSLRPVRWLALRTPALYKDEGWELPKRQLHQDPDLIPFRHRQVAWKDNRALRACAEFRGDALIVEAELDQIIPHQVIENYMAAFTRARSRTSRRDRRRRPCLLRKAGPAHLHHGAGEVADRDGGRRPRTGRPREDRRAQAGAGWEGPVLLDARGGQGQRFD